MGLTIGKRRCRNQIAKTNRDEARRIILRLSSFDLSYDGFEDLLDELATCTLCQARHAKGKPHDQHDDTVTTWGRLIDVAVGLILKDRDTIMGQPGDTKENLWRDIHDIVGRMERL